ncbi:MAG: hypothetical protein RL220_125, partial [Bacteroidota bacterium]
ELVPPMEVILHLAGFLAGIALFQALSFFYFSYTNKDITHLPHHARTASQAAHNPVDTTLHNRWKWLPRRTRPRWHVETYLSRFNRIAIAREGTHYSKSLVDEVLAQNHLNASRFEVVLILSFLAAGVLREYEYFHMPAGASTLLFFTMIIMVLSAVHSWVKGWTVTVVLALLAIITTVKGDLDVFGGGSKAYGLDYDTAPARYDPLNSLPDEKKVQDDYRATAEILDRWRKRLHVQQDEKPKLVIINCSGGGTRSAYWTMRSLMYADSITGGALLDHTVMMTGASGGMLGAAYMRELMLRKFMGEPVSLYDSTYAEDISKDLLNPVMLSMVTNDWFVRFQYLKDGDHVYSKDRSFAFERELNQNTRNFMARRLRDYTLPESQAIIPMVVLSPTIVNDGRRLIIASQPVSYLTQSTVWDKGYSDLHEDVEFAELFKSQDAEQLHFTTALRMNATFPYVFPVTVLPSDPPVEVMDAGIRDNFGLKTTMRFLHTFRNWINTNTSGVIILQIRDLPRDGIVSDFSTGKENSSSGPLGSIYGNITRTHDYNHEQMLNYLQASVDGGVELVTFELEQTRENHISLSWHLTESEKRFIRKSTQNESFRKELERLTSLLNSGKESSGH